MIRRRNHPSLSFGRAALRWIPAFALAAALSAAHAQEEDAAEKLQETQSSLEEARARKERLAAETGKLSSELAGLQKELASMAAKLQANETQLTRMESENAQHGEKIAQAEAALARREAEHGQVMESLIRLSILPPEAVLLSPGGMKEAFVTETALAAFMKELRAEAENIRLQLVELKAMKEEAARRQVEIVAEKQALQKSRLALDAKIRERGKLLKAASADNEALAAQISALSKQSKDLKELLEKLEASRREAEERRKAEAAKTGRPARKRQTSEMRSFADAKGRLRLPASGKITSSPEGIGGADGKSLGIAIASREFAQVISPFDGEVVYAGAFRGYGNMLIIRHTDDYHTLIAGLEKIDCVPGQMVVEGEPVGAMGGGENKRLLYLELRERGKPIDPKPWLESRTKG